MSTSAGAKLKLVPRSEACKRLGIGRTAFWTKWHAIFTETRAEGTSRRDRKVFSDELEVAVESGPNAVLLYRRQMRRRAARPVPHAPRKPREAAPPASDRVSALEARVEQLERMVATLVTAAQRSA